MRNPISHDNNPAVGLATRKWLAALKRDDLVLQDSIEYILSAIDKCRYAHPGGMVLDMSLCLGANSSSAMIAGSIAEMFYAVCSLTDDIQDDETDSYLQGLSTALLINIQSQFLCLIAVRANDLVAHLGPAYTQRLVTEIYRTGARMLSGQQLELARSPWNEAMYDKVARLSAGEQFSLYMRLSALVSKQDRIAEFAELGRIFGTLLQYVVDKEMCDSRLDIIHPFVLSTIYKRLSNELCSVAETLLEPEARRPVDGLIERCRAIERL